jgi:DNA polymerase (family 10)
MTNSDICKVFRDIADLLDIKGENPFKVRAYRRVVTSIEELAVPITQLALENRLDEIPGAGEAIRKKIIELVNTGHLEYYEKLKAEFPDGVMELLAVPGVGPKTAEMLIKDMQITSVDALEKALGSGKELPHIGEKTREKILQGIRDMKNAGREKR